MKYLKSFFGMFYCVFNCVNYSCSHIRVYTVGRVNKFLVLYWVDFFDTMVRDVFYVFLKSFRLGL